MLTAIPMHGNRIAGHLARAPQVAIFDQRGCEIARYDNPAAAEHCCGGGCHHGAEPATPSLLQPRHSQNGAPHIVRCQRI